MATSALGIHQNGAVKKLSNVYQQVSTTRALLGAGIQMEMTSLYLGKLVKLLFLPFLHIYEVSFML